MAPFAQHLRLLSMIVMLVIIGMTIARNGRWGAPAVVAPPAAADPDVAAAPEGEARPPQNAPPQPAASAPKPKKDAADKELAEGEPACDQPADDQLSDDEQGSLNAPPPVRDAGEIAEHHDDRDPAEVNEFRRQAEAIVDWGLAIQGIENPAYWRLLEWIKGQSLSQLKERDPPAAVFQQLRQRPGKFRGKLLELELSVRRVVTYDVEKENPAGVKRLYELWGWPTEGRGWFYVVVTPELPPGFPTDISVAQTVRVYGYFFKLQGYQPANAQPNAPPLAAPMLVGRVEWIRLVTPTNPAETALSYIILAVGGLLVVGMIGYWIVVARRKKAARQSRAEDVPAVAAHALDDDEDDTRTPYEREYEKDVDERDSDRPPPAPSTGCGIRARAHTAPKT